jgi:uncharacterized protein
VKEIQPPVEGVLIMTPKKETDAVVADCLEAGVKHVWLYGGMAPGAATPSAVSALSAKGVNVIKGLCPYMFLPDSSSFHGFHRFIKKLNGSYPKSA